MRSGSASTHARLLRLFARNAEVASRARLSRVRIDDEKLDGDAVTIDGQRLVNFGSCAYMGLNLDPRLIAGAKEALDRYGPVFSSSTAYTSVPLYTQLEELLEDIFEMPVIVPTTTTLGHLSFLPTVVEAGSAVVIDSQAHSSLHLATQLLTAAGIPVHVVEHNDLDALDGTLSELLPRFEKVWYLADGVYSMYGDVMPVSAIKQRLDANPKLWAYIDDAHGFGWAGRSGRGYVLDQIGRHERMVIAVSLSKSFGSGGAAIAFPDRDMANRVQVLGGTMTFSGPLHPAELGASLASARIHLSAEHSALADRLSNLMEFTRDRSLELALPIASFDQSPIWFAEVGTHAEAVEVGSRMKDGGFYLNVASFPAVPPGRSGLRFTTTVYHSADQIGSMLKLLGETIAEVLGMRKSSHADDELVIDITAGADTVAPR